MRNLPARCAALSLAALLLAGCAGSGTGSAAGPAPSAELTGTVTVFAAASLKTTFTELAGKFEAAHPGTEVALSFAGSSDLATQISGGAPADVFASADSRNMDKLTAEDLIEGVPVNFATNILTIAVPRDNPASIDSLADLARPGVKLVLCAPQVPCGAAAVTVQRAAGLTLAPVSEESSVTDVLGKVAAGEADAGLVYVTDVAAAAGTVTGLGFGEAPAAVNTYPIGAVTGGANPAAARAFVELVTGDEGRMVLTRAGFGTP